MAYVDPHEPDHDYTQKRAARKEAEARRQREAMGEASFDDILFRRGSTYNGTPAQLAQLAARAGKRVES